MSATMTANWTPMGDVDYRKIELYQMAWFQKLNIANYIIAAAPYGGPIAMMRDTTKSATKAPNSRPIIYIYNAAGIELVAFTWDCGPLQMFDWSQSEDLLCVQTDGVVHVYDMFHVHKRTFNMGAEAKDTRIVDCKIFDSNYGTGIAVLTTNYRVFVVNNVDNPSPRVRQFAEVPGIMQPPSSWCVITLDRQTHVLMARDNELYMLENTGQCVAVAPPMSVTVSAYVEMSISRNNKSVALLADNGTLWVGSSDLKKAYCEFETKCTTRPKQLVWCANGAVAYYHNKLLLLVGPEKHFIKYSMDEPVHLVAEIDGIRLIGNRLQEFVQKVPGVVGDVFRIGSIAPGCMLLEAWKEYESGSPKADEYLRVMKNKLPSAVDQCIEAAGCEHEPKLQKDLLKAASFGKHFVSGHSPKPFVDMCQMLRVLNAIKDYRIGLPLTYMQFEHLSLPVLIDRLINRKLYPMAIELCQYLKMSDSEGRSRVLAHWACNKVQQTNAGDPEIAKAIVSKLENAPGISYSEIALKACESGQHELAIKLLDYEPRSREQVRLLLRMKEDINALQKALDSGDPDLVYVVLTSLEALMKPSEFLMTLRDYPIAQGLFIKHCKYGERRRKLKGIYEPNDNYSQIALFETEEAYIAQTAESSKVSLRKAMEAFRMARNDFDMKATEDEIRLVVDQKHMEEEYKSPKSYSALSLHETVKKLIGEKLFNRADALKNKFKIPDKHYWWLKITTLAETGGWDELDKFSRGKKSPIGYAPFVQVCMNFRNALESRKYTAKLLANEKVKGLVYAGELQEAGNVAIQNKNEDEVNMVIQKCTMTGQHQLADKIQTHYNASVRR